MYDPFAPPPAPGNVAITSAPAPAPASGPIVDPNQLPQTGGAANGLGPAPNNAIAGLYPGIGMPGGMPGGGMGDPRNGRFGKWFGQQGWGDGRFNFQGFRDAWSDWRADRPTDPRGSDAWGEWRADRPRPASYFGQPAAPQPGIAVGEPYPLPPLPPITTTG